MASLEEYRKKDETPVTVADGQDMYQKALTWLCAFVPIDKYVPVDKAALMKFSGIGQVYATALLAELVRHSALVRKRDLVKGYVYQRLPLLNHIPAKRVKEGIVKLLTDRKAKPVDPEEYVAPITSGEYVMTAEEAIAFNNSLKNPNLNKSHHDQLASTVYGSSPEVHQKRPVEYGFVANGHVTWCGADRDHMITVAKDQIGKGVDSIVLITRIGIVRNVPTVELDPSA